MSDEGDEKVKRLPVRFKAPPGDDAPHLSVVGPFDGGCNHKNHFVGGRLRQITYAIRDGETEVECGGCGVKLDPMWVLRQIAAAESQWNMHRERYNAEMARLSERKATRCEHCQRMTRISRTKARA